LLSTFGTIGVSPSKIVLDTGIGLGWVIETALDRTLKVIEDAQDLIELEHSELLGVAIRAYIRRQVPPWIRLAASGRSPVLTFMPSEERQVFQESGLAEGTSESTIAFWDNLAKMARGELADRRNVTGRNGERLSLKYEAQRTGCEARWIAIESNAEGYDVLSRVGPYDNSPLTIEVKTSAAGLSGDAFITRNEWELASTSKAHHYHLWALSASISLAVISAETMREHVPVDMGNGKWEVFRIPFKKFEGLFGEVL